jgi:hypothetical protein
MELAEFSLAYTLITSLLASLFYLYGKLLLERLEEMGHAVCNYNDMQRC